LKIAAKPLQIGTWLLLTAYRKLPAPYPMVPSRTPYDLPFCYNTAQLPFKSSKVNVFHVIWKPTCDFLLVIST